MQPHQLRVVEELNALTEKREKLGVFILRNAQFTELPSGEQYRLRVQFRIMGEYSDILRERVEAFLEDPPPKSISD